MKHSVVREKDNETEIKPTPLWCLLTRQIEKVPTCFVKKKKINAKVPI